jgi:putative transposase
MFVAGISTHKVGEVAQTLLRVAPSGSRDQSAQAEEGKDGWVGVPQDLRARGATQIDLIVTDGQEGVLAATGQLFAATPRQRCLVHKQRNILNAIPRRERTEVAAELVAIWQQPSKQEAVLQLEASTRQIQQTLSRSGEKPG